MIKEVSAGVVVFKDDLVLIIKHKNGHIDFPKGHVEGNETLEETAIREVFEETGINCRIDSDEKYMITYSPKDGYIKGTKNCHTDKAGIFVAGDVRDKEIRQLVTATSDGAIAATTALEEVIK